MLRVEHKMGKSASFLQLNMHWPYNPGILRFHPPEMKTYPHKNLYVNADSGFIHYLQESSTTQMSFTGWTLG